MFCFRIPLSLQPDRAKQTSRCLKVLVETLCLLAKLASNQPSSKEAKENLVVFQRVPNKTRASSGCCQRSHHPLEKHFQVFQAQPTQLRIHRVCCMMLSLFCFSNKYVIFIFLPFLAATLPTRVTRGPSNGASGESQNHFLHIVS